MALSSITGESVLTNKVSSLCLLLAAAGGVGLRYRQDGALAAFAVSLILLPGCVVLWTFGGLETPLLLFLVAAATLLATSERAPVGKSVHWICLLAGLALLARYDSVLYFAPLALAALWREASRRDRLLALVLAAVFPLAWLACARVYYGDILPTSYYTKTPHFGPGRVIRNAKYISLWLAWGGLLPALPVWWLGRSRPFVARTVASVKAYWPLYVGIALELAYGLSMATSHMMYSFRCFVPYFPAVAILLAESIRAEGAAAVAAAESRRWRTTASAFVLVASVCHAAFAWNMYYRSLNGPVPLIEFHITGARDFMGTFPRILEEQAEVIRADWAKRPASAERPPRIVIYAGGILPHALPDAYIYENLVSYRHGRWRLLMDEFPETSDYVVTVEPLFTSEEQFRRNGGEDYESIFSRDAVLEGMPNRYRVYFNPTPRANELCPRIDCVPVGSTAGDLALPPWSFSGYHGRR